MASAAERGLELAQEGRWWAGWRWPRLPACLPASPAQTGGSGRAGGRAGGCWMGTGRWAPRRWRGHTGRGRWTLERLQKVQVRGLEKSEAAAVGTSGSSARGTRTPTPSVAGAAAPGALPSPCGAAGVCEPHIWQPHRLLGGMPRPAAPPGAAAWTACLPWVVRRGTGRAGGDWQQRRVITRRAENRQMFEGCDQLPLLHV